MINKFKIGDLVKGKAGSNYGITNEKSVCKVLKFMEENQIYVEVIEYPIQREIGNQYVVSTNKMELIAEKVVEEEIEDLKIYIQEDDVTITDNEGDVITITKKQIKEIYKKIK